MSVPVLSVNHSASTKIKITALNSTIIYILTYMLAQGLYQAATVLMALRLSIPGTWHVSSIKFSIADPEWWRSGVLAVYGIGPAVCAVAAIGAGLWFWHRARLKRGAFKLILFWFTLHACNLVLGALVADTFEENWAWYIPSWLFLAGNGINITLAIIAGIMQVGFGYFAAIGFLQSHDSISLMRYENRRRLITMCLVLPWLAGSLVVALFKLPELSDNELGHFLSMGLLVVPIAIKSAQDLFEFTVPEPRKTRLDTDLLLLTGGLCLVWWLVLRTGLPF
ncbi:hypothetical protein [Hymenobacter chitinivorans]|uniref:Uncharacterized protein n=1 Tax=Hymenobacter chitinivorans DSM 11115 TaxID=1121954 RepID=A0A2M9BQX1_9BACT|nr:hypothetical protein [Hymenobacter chitinivorans]PJJ60302.1 hypothetical protein CLV45_1727 [Hymenobacter chitinivorans DSM 11115]